MAQRYLRCIGGGIPAGTGVPDGDGRLAVVLNKKYATVIKPVGGRIRFLIGYSNAGCISQQVGDTSVPRLRCEYATSADPELNFYYPTSSTIPGLLQQSTGLDSYSALGARSKMTVSRLVNAYHEQSFTGPALNNGGTVTITEVREDQAGRIRQFNPAGQNGLDYMKVNALTTGDLPPSAIVGPARETRHILMLPRDSSYGGDQRVYYRNEAGKPDNYPFGITGQAEALTPNRYYTGVANHPSVRMRLVEYSGQDDSATITISSNICSQHLIQASSSMHALARPSEAANQSWLSNFLSRVNIEPLVASSASALRGVVDRAAHAALHAVYGMAAHAIQDL